MVDKFEVWWKIMECDYALKRMELVNCCNCAKIRKLKERKVIEGTILMYLHSPHLSGIANDIKTYDDFVNSQEVKDWINANAPKGYDFSKSPFDKENKKFLGIKTSVYDLEKLKISRDFLKKYIRSAGFSSVEDAGEDVYKLAKRFCVNPATVRGVMTEYFKCEKADEKLESIKRSIERKRERQK